MLAPDPGWRSLTLADPGLSYGFPENTNTSLKLSLQVYQPRGRAGEIVG
jgi:hypothetical protein